MLESICRQVLKMVARKPRIMFSCSEEVKAELESWAEDEARSVSNLVELIVMQAITTRNKNKKSQTQQTGED